MSRKKKRGDGEAKPPSATAVANPQPESQPLPQPEPQPLPQPEPQPLPQPEPQPLPQLQPEPQPEPLPLPQLQPEPPASRPPSSAPADSPSRSNPAIEAAALEAARMVSEVVDIETPTGAVIAAAAAANAAIEAQRGDSSEPVTTIKLSRERILQAIADEPEPTAEPIPRARTERPEPATADRAPTGNPKPRAASASGDLAPAASASGNLPLAARATSEHPSPYDDQPDFDPMQVAAAVIQRLRRRARTDLAELTVQYHRHDILVVLLALVIIFAAGRLYTRLVTPPDAAFSSHGLTFEHPSGWLAEPTPLPSPRLIHDMDAHANGHDSLYHVTLTSPLESTAHIEVLVDRQPEWKNIVTSLDLDRRTRWGELYMLDSSSVETIADHQWLRTEYHYAHGDKRDTPRVDRAIEYATVDRDQSYVVTLFGSPAELARIEDVVAPSLRTATKFALPLVPQTSRVFQPDYTSGVARAFDSTVMVVAANMENGRLRPKVGGSGVIVGGDGSILTSFHLLHDPSDPKKLYDVFVIGRYSSLDQAPQLWCAGKPSRDKLQPELDLALIKCDMDLDGREWDPTSAGGVWPKLPEAQAADIQRGQRLWVLGYPDVGGGGLTLTSGAVQGWSGANGAPGADFLKTNIATSNGSSGGPVVDDQGRLVGISAATRSTVVAKAETVEVTKQGMVRPLSAASDLLAIATAGWKPREGHTEVSLAPTAVEATAEGIHLSTKVQDASTEAPIRDAIVMVLRPEVKKSDIDINQLDDQVLAWGQTNTSGEVLLKQPVPVPGTYSVLVMARGYEVLIGENELHLDENTPQSFDPWGQIWLRPR